MNVEEIQRLRQENQDLSQMVQQLLQAVYSAPLQKKLPIVYLPHVQVRGSTEHVTDIEADERYSVSREAARDHCIHWFPNGSQALEFSCKT